MTRTICTLLILERIPRILRATLLIMKMGFVALVISMLLIVTRMMTVVAAAAVTAATATIIMAITTTTTEITITMVSVYRYTPGPSLQ